MQPENNAPTVLVVFGVTGDLFAKKIASALSELFRKQKLPEKFRVVGFSRRDLNTNIFRKEITPSVCSPSTLGIVKLFSYVQGFFDEQKSYDRLLAELKKIDAKWGMCSHKLFYLAVPPSLYPLILKNIASSKLSKTCSEEGRFTRILIEKPFGSDEKSAEKLDALIKKTFKENQIYRIDHYLAKEMLQNVFNFRVSHGLFGKEWSDKTVEKIEVRLLEEIGVEDRGAFYDGIGALRDMGQSHISQMLAVTTMDKPRNDSASSYRAARAEVLGKLTPDTKFLFREQYHDYRTIKGVVPNSQTETYFKTRAFLKSPQWKGVEIVMESGKKMGEMRKEIVVYLKNGKKLLFQFEPEEAIFNDGVKLLLKENPEKTAAYQKILSDCIAGDQTLFVSSSEVKNSWKFTDKIIRAWRAKKIPLVIK